MGYIFDSNPRIGQVLKKYYNFIIAGINSHNIPTIWLAAKELARMGAQGIPFKKTSMPRLFKTS